MKPEIGRSPEPRAREPGVPEGRVVVVFHPRSIVIALGVVLAMIAAVELILLAQAGLTLLVIALFLALALNPAVESLQRHGLRRAPAVGVVYVLALAVLAVLGSVFIPPLVDQISKLVGALPSLVDDLTKGHGPLGFLERKYQVVERIRSATTGQNAGGLLGPAGSALAAVKGIATTVFGSVIIAFLTFFMLLEGPEWRRRCTELIPETHRGVARAHRRRGLSLGRGLCQREPRGKSAGGARRHDHHARHRRPLRRAARPFRRDHRTCALRRPDRGYRDRDGRGAHRGARCRRLWRWGCWSSTTWSKVTRCARSSTGAQCSSPRSPSSSRSCSGRRSPASWGRWSPSPSPGPFR